MQKIIFLKCFMSLAFLQGHICWFPISAGNWTECNGFYYYFSAKKYSWEASCNFCSQLADETNVADFGTNPFALARNCNFALKANNPYWIECSYGQPQSVCTTLKLQGQILVRNPTPYNTLAYPICGTRKAPIKTMTKQSATTTKPTITITATHFTHATITKRLSNTLINRKTETMSTIRKPTQVPATVKMTRAQTLKNKINPPSTRKTTHISITGKSTYEPTTKNTTVLRMTTKSITNVPTTRKFMHDATKVITTAAQVSTTNKITQNPLNTTSSFITPLKATLGASARTLTYMIKSKNLKNVLETKMSKFEYTTNISKQKPITNTMKQEPTVRQAKHALSTRESKHMPIALYTNQRLGNVIHAPFAKHSSQTAANRYQTEARTIIKTTHVVSTLTPQQKSTAIMQSHPRTIIAATPPHISRTVRYAQSTLIQTTENTKLHTTGKLAMYNASIPSVYRAFTKTATVRTSYGQLTSLTITESPWVLIDTREYFVNYLKYNLSFAQEYCIRAKDAFLLTSLNPIRYFQILSRLNLRDGSYWIGGQFESVVNCTNGCLIYNSLEQSLSQHNPSHELYSICSKSAFGNNTNDILENVAFKQMLKDMTLDKTGTAVNRRHKTSVNNDHRWSVRATGVVGIFITCLVTGLMVLSDLIKTGSCQCYRLCKCYK